MAIQWKKSDLPTLAEKKVKMAVETCQALIYGGIDVELSTGVQHFSLETHDQANIDSMAFSVTLGATGYPYHADGDKCKVFSADDIIKIYVAYKSFVTQQTTYCNFLKIWINRETDSAVLGKIVYGSEVPDDLAEEMQSVLDDAAVQINELVDKLRASGAIS